MRYRLPRNMFLNLWYDPKLLVMDRQLKPPVVFRIKSEKGITIFAVSVADIPRGMALNDSGDYVMGFYRKIPQVKNPEIYKQELIKLSDGTEANYVEIYWSYRWFDMLTVVVFVYKDNKIIGAAAIGSEEMLKEYLAGMAKSLRFKN